MLDGILNGVTGILDKVIPDATERMKAENEVLRLMMSNADKQAEVNAVEAAHKSTFVAGWRPAIGWAGAIALFTMFVAKPMVVFGAALYGVDPTIIAQIVDFTLDTGELMTLVGGMLGLASARTFEKTRGVASNSIGKAITGKIAGLIGGKK